MNILFLTQILPYPPDSGPKVKTWNVLKYLSENGHKISLASYVRPEEQPYVETVKKVCSQVYIVPIKRSRLADIGYLLRSQVSRRPFLVERDDLYAMRSVVTKIVESEHVDVIHADQLTMAQFALPFADRPTGKPALVFDAHNAVWTIIKRMNETLPFYYRLPLLFEAGRVKAYEAKIVTKFNSTLAVAEPDRQALIAAVREYYPNYSIENAPITVIPIAVDTKQIQPVPRQTDSLNILTMGTLYYPPNADGIRWFIQDVFPLIQRALPEVKLTVVGKILPGISCELPRKVMAGWLSPAMSPTWIPVLPNQR